MTKEELKNFVFVGIISADNPEFTEETKQQIMARYKENPNDFSYVLEPIEDVDLREKYIKLLTV